MFGSSYVSHSQFEIFKNFMLPKHLERMGFLKTQQKCITKLFLGVLYSRESNKDDITLFLVILN